MPPPAPQPVDPQPFDPAPQPVVPNGIMTIEDALMRPDVPRIRTLLDGSAEDRDRLEEALLRLPTRGWIALDAAVRGHERLSRIDVTFDARGSRLALAFGTMSANGYLREAAVEALAIHTAPVIVPFLVLRTADWVPEVAALAREELRGRVEVDDMAVAAALPLALALAGRARTGGLAAELLDRVVPERPALLELLLAASDASTRRAAVRIALERDLLATEDLVRIATRDRDTGVAIDAGTAAVERSRALDDRQTLVRLLAGRARVRRLVVDAMPLYAEGAAMVEARLFDRSALVRAGAQLALARVGVDVYARYRAGLTDPRRRRVAILGLGSHVATVEGSTPRSEEQRIADGESIRELLGDERAAVRAAAVRASEALLGRSAVPAILPLLEDAAPSVARAAVDVLRVYPSQVPIATLVDAAGTDRPPHVRRGAISLIRDRSVVPRLMVDLQLVRRRDGRIRDEAEDDLRSWLQHEAPQQPRPSLADRRQLAEELGWSRDHLPAGWADLIAFHLGLRSSDLS